MHRLWQAGKLDGKRDFFKCMGREPPHPRTIVIGGEDSVVIGDSATNQEKQNEEGNVEDEVIPLNNVKEQKDVKQE